jgi:hypothetical protein
MTCGDVQRHNLSNVAAEWDRLARRAEGDNDEMSSRWRRIADKAAAALARYAELSEEVGE